MSLLPAAKIDRILVVDDAPDNLFLVETILKQQGYQITLANNGETAIAETETSPPDLIILDVMMPKMDGYEVTRRIRQNLKLPFIPILLLTAHQQSSVVAGLDAGADDFIRKPMDIDELLARVRSLLRLKHSVDEREQMLRQREDFVSRLTHDLRTPLIAMDRMLSLITQEAFGEITADLENVLTSMIGNNKNLLSMVNTLLEVYRHDAGQKTLTYVPCNLQELVQEVVQELIPLANERGIDLITRSVESQAPTVMGDHLELRRVLTNLIGNAIKFTEAGSVSIGLTLPSSEANNSFVKIEIKDTGIGIPFEDQAVLFERYRHGNHKRAGSGLGLYLSRRIVEAHRGKIEVKSQPQQGSLFSIYLPINQFVSIDYSSPNLS